MTENRTSFVTPASSGAQADAVRQTGRPPPRRHEDVATVGAWLSAILAAALGVGISDHTSYHQFAIGVLVALLALGAALGALELLCRLCVRLFGASKH